MPLRCPVSGRAPEVSLPLRCALTVACPRGVLDPSILHILTQVSLSLTVGSSLEISCQLKVCPGVSRWMVVACLALRDHVLISRGSGNGFWREEPVGVLRRTSNRGPAEGWIELRWLVFGPVFFMCC